MQMFRMVHMNTVHEISLQVVSQNIKCFSENSFFEKWACHQKTKCAVLAIKENLWGASKTETCLSIFRSIPEFIRTIFINRFYI